MVVIVLEKVSRSLRGFLSRWMIEVRTGTFVGGLGRRVREAVWKEVCGSLKTGSAFIVFKSDNEQGYEFDFWGCPSRRVRDFDGLQLMEIYTLPESAKCKVKRLKKDS